MLYFSQAKQDPDKIDLEQLSKLRKFKEKTFPRALIETFSNQVEFRDKLAKQIEIQIRELISEIAGEELDGSNIRSVTDVQLHFADPKTGQDLGDHIELNTTFLDVSDMDKLPDYEMAEKDKSREEIQPEKTTRRTRAINKNYYRDIVEYVVQQNLFKPIRFWIKNIGGIGARDAYIEIRASSELKSFSILPTSRLVKKPRVSLSPYFEEGDILESAVFRPTPIGTDAQLEGEGGSWTTNFELRALQPQRIITPPVKWLIGCPDHSIIGIDARIYADTLAEPLSRSLQLEFIVKTEKISAQDIVDDYLATLQIEK